MENEQLYQKGDETRHMPIGLADKLAEEGWKPVVETPKEVKPKAEPKKPDAK